MKLNIGVIFGGRSGEHEISIRSAMTVIDQIDKSRYNVIPIGISSSGVWLSPADSIALLPQETRSLLPEKIHFNTNDTSLDIPAIEQGASPSISEGHADHLKRLDVAFPVLHGTYGEDGTIQGVFEMADIPYVGCGVVASACGMDKVMMKILFRDAGLPICEHVWFLRSEWENDGDAVVSHIEKVIGYPCFIKPANLGSSVGVSKADDRESLRRSIAKAAEFDRKIIVEEALEAREIECAVIGNDNPKASLPGEYLIRDKSRAFLDYTEKYAGTGNNEFVVPAPVSDELSIRIQNLAISAFKAVDGSGLGRVDFFLVNDTDRLLVSEINTLPGLTDASGFPKMLAATGMDFPEVIDELVELAFQRHRDKSRNRTSLVS